jgi:hypothetical protein
VKSFGAIVIGRAMVAARAPDARSGGWHVCVDIKREHRDSSYSIVAMHSISTLPPRARPEAPKALRAGRFVEKCST